MEFLRPRLPILTKRQNQFMMTPTRQINALTTFSIQFTLHGYFSQAYQTLIHLTSASTDFRGMTRSPVLVQFYFSNIFFFSYIPFKLISFLSSVYKTNLYKLSIPLHLKAIIKIFRSGSVQTSAQRFSMQNLNNIIIIIKM